MKKWKERMRRFLEKRNGMDSLGVFLMGLSFGLLLLGVLLRALVLELAGLGFLIYGYVRMFSKKLENREEENRQYLALRESLRFKMQTRILHLKMLRTHKYVKCKRCGQKMRVPRKRDRSKVTCPGCGEEF